MISRHQARRSVGPWAYTKTAIALHWLLAFLLTGMVALGWYMMSIEKRADSRWYFDLHKSIGITVLALVLARLVWRTTHRPRSLSTTLPAWQNRLASWTQGLLYVLMLLIPITGLCGALLGKRGVAFFGYGLPHFTPNHTLSEQLFALHGTIVWGLVGLVALHAAGGLKHLLIDRDGVFHRMWPSAR